jgi:hypothetical protein
MNLGGRQAPARMDDLPEVSVGRERVQVGLHHFLYE